MVDTEKSDASNGLQEPKVVGSSQLFREDGQLRSVPMPTPDPKDPLNLPTWRKWLAIGTLCLFGALAVSIEYVISQMLPVFALEYAGCDQGRVSEGNASTTTTTTTNPSSHVSLLATLPMVASGAASFLLVPLSIAVGRRPVLLLCGLAAWAGGFWAGSSRGLGGHLAARCLQGLGSGVVDALVPLIVQDMTFIHQRGNVLAAMGAAMTVVTVCLNIASPYAVKTHGWRFLYRAFSAAAASAWVLLILFVPETRQHRSKEELAGQEVWPLEPGDTRPRLDFVAYSARTIRTDLAIFTPPAQWARGAHSIWDTIRSAAFPNLLWAALLLSAGAALGGAVSQTQAAALLGGGWPFERLGLAGLALAGAGLLAGLLAGPAATRAALALAARTPAGAREPEHLLWGAAAPAALTIAGALAYAHGCARVAEGAAGAGAGGGAAVLAAVLAGFATFVVGIVACGTVLCVYVVECYPNIAGPVLVTMSSIRLIIGFGFSVKAADWIETSGFMVVFGAYTALFGALSLLGIPVYLYGKRIRAWAVGTLATAEAALGGGDPPRNEGRSRASSSTRQGDDDSSRDQDKGCSGL